MIFFLGKGSASTATKKGQMCAKLHLVEARVFRCPKEPLQVPTQLPPTFKHREQNANAAHSKPGRHTTSSSKTTAEPHNAQQRT